MAKVCEKDFPKGTYRKQLSDGFYMEGYLKENLDIFAKKIADDQMFVIVITGSGFVRVGKSVLAQQIGYYLNHKVNELHKTNNKFDIKNIIFKGNELQEKAFQMPKYSVITLDEGDDLVEHYWSKLAKDLRRFFRKCGQLNQFVILVLPDYFELPRSYAITRSMCLINVKYVGEFDRGFFDFYNFEQKKQLYLKGKKTSDYKCVPASFSGRFANAYTINEEEYREKKRKDLEEQEENEKDNKELENKKLWMRIAYLIKILYVKYNASPIEMVKEINMSKDTYYKLEKELPNYYPLIKS